MGKPLKYQVYWEGSRISWQDQRGAHSGLVLEAQMRRCAGYGIIYLRVARDDGYIEVGLDSRQVEARIGPQEESNA